MKKKILTVMLSAVMAVTMLVGCGDSVETGGRTRDRERDRESENVSKETTGGMSLFPSTIFDDIVIIDTTLGDVEKLFNARGLAYENTHRSFVNTTITDEFGDWEVQYFCGFTVPPDYVVSDNVVIDDGQIFLDITQGLPEIDREEMTLSQWTTILFLNEDSEYRDAVKLIQSVIDQHKLDSYDYQDVSYYHLQQFYGLDNYKCDEVVCYPIKTLEYAGMDCLEYLLFGKIPNYNKNDVSHVIFFSVGIMLEQNYQEGVLLPISIDYVSLAALWNVEIYDGTGNNTGNVPLSKTATYPLTDRLMVQLKQSVDAQGNTTGANMITFYMSLAMNTEHDDYSKYGSDETLKGLEIEIKSEVAKVVRDYTEQESRDNFAAMEEEILIAIQNLFGSDFIYKVAISDVVFQ